MHRSQNRRALDARFPLPSRIEWTCGVRRIRGATGIAMPCLSDETGGTDTRRVTCRYRYAGQGGPVRHGAWCAAVTVGGWRWQQRLDAPPQRVGQEPFARVVMAGDDPTTGVISA